MQVKDIEHIVIDRPAALNALNFATLEKLRQQLEVCTAKIVIITGAGHKAFISGADIKEMYGMSREEWHRFFELGHAVMHLLETGSFVTIAALNGYTFGGGLELSLACDMIVASETAQLGVPEVKLGLIPSFGGVPRLHRAVGKYKANELIMTGKTISAEEACALGIVNQITSPELLIEECEKLAHSILDNSFTAVMEAKKVAHSNKEWQAAEACFAHSDRKERMQAFLR